MADPLRAHLVRLLDWRDAHVDFDRAVRGIPRRLRGAVPRGCPYSPWQLLEHMRIAQRDILEFCVNPAYDETHGGMRWPDDYWPRSAAPP
ncbi:MAG TPA: hypothetical protein VNI78_03825, partial [Vicinamibacterales bacterium]|nr:hypothetical protein [Vicinamibacterales bacterium]